MPASPLFRIAETEGRSLPGHCALGGPEYHTEVKGSARPYHYFPARTQIIGYRLPSQRSKIAGEEVPAGDSVVVELENSSWCV